MSNALKVIDLYSGVGGLSLSAIKAGFQVIGAVEKEKRIIDSHAINFPTTTHICDDVSKLSGKQLGTGVKLGKEELAGVIGGPPCQGFSSIGNGILSDERNLLFSHFFRIVSEMKPAFFVAENVPGIMNEKYNEIRKKAFKVVEKGYDLLEPLTIEADKFGAATIRKRIFFIGIRKDCQGANLIVNEINSVKTFNGTLVKEALVGLPQEVSEDWQDFESSWQKLSSASANAYVRSINEFYTGVGNEISVKRLIDKSEVSGFFGTRHSPEIISRFTKLMPGQQDRISKSQKLNAEGYCPTLRAGTDYSRGSFQAVRPIHPFLPRVITPREAARLQGFPDWFQFHETKWHSFRQIGNSVCPIAASKVLKAIKTSINI